MMAQYSFEPYLKEVHSNWYSDDALLKQLLDHYAPEASRGAEDRLISWGNEVSGHLRELAECSATPENAPSLKHFDAYNNRIDEVVLPASTQEALKIVSGREGLGAVHGDPYVFYSKGYLYAQNGEAGVGCSMACTDGLVRVLEALGDHPEHRSAVDLIRGSSYERVYHGAQFATEIQGGSDIPANVVRAVPDGDAYRLLGQKWFCSNINADYFLVTARPEGAPEGSRGVGLFLVPARLDESDGQRNGYSIDRLKNKFGTRELATAEVTFDGAIAYAIGPLDSGLANLVKHVLVTSRFACVLSAAGYLRQAERIAMAYTQFRTAFGVHIRDFPIVREDVDTLTQARERALAVVFELLHLWEKAQQAQSGAVDALDFRVMMSLAKVVLTRRTAHFLHDAMMLLGGNGIEEEFSPLPRLYRDAVILETWEGPHNVLLSQALRDLKRFKIDSESFVERVAGPNHGELTSELKRILASETELEMAIPFRALSEKLVDGMADRVLHGLAQPAHEVPS